MNSCSNSCSVQVRDEYRTDYDPDILLMSIISELLIFDLIYLLRCACPVGFSLSGLLLLLKVFSFALVRRLPKNWTVKEVSYTKASI